MLVRTLVADVVTADTDTPVTDLTERMREKNVGDVVITEENEPIGIVTDRDIALEVGNHDDLSAITAGEIMTSDLLTVDTDTPITDLPAVMDEGGVRRMPVVNDHGKLVGIVTLDDVVSTVSGMLDDVESVIGWQSREYTAEK